MNTKQEEQIQTAVRLPKSMIARVDKIAARMTPLGANPITRSEAIRLCIAQGATQIEKAKKR